MGVGTPIENRAAMAEPDFDRLSAELVCLNTMSKALIWFTAQSPPLAPESMIPQDEFSFDLIVPYHECLYLTFDTT